MNHDHDSTLREEELGARIRAAGPRAAIPATDLETLRAAARAAWLETAAVERRRRLRRRAACGVAASLVLALIAGGWWVGRRAPLVPREIATVELLTRPARAIQPDAGTSVFLGVGDTVREGTTLETADDEGAPCRLALRLAGGASVRLDSGSRLRLVSRSRLELESGTVYVDTGARGSATAERLEILVRRGVVREIGTQFEVALPGDGAVRVRVREGSVSLDREGASHAADRGEELALADDGSVERRTLDPEGSHWEWVLAAAPAIDIEGRALGSYLEWVARETGWRVVWADEALERSAREIRLHGAIDGLRPDESLPVILEGSGLDHQVEADTVRIDRR